MSQPQPLDLDAIQTRLDAATEGPWTTDDSEIVAEVIAPASWVARTDGDGEADRANAEFIAHARQDVPALLARVRQLEAENERLRTAWHSARRRASTAREHLDITEHGRDRAIEAAEQLQAELTTERAVALSNQQAARFLAEDVQRLTAELAEAHAATKTNREVGRVLLTELAAHRQPAT
ncbi:hypothetical protein ACFC1T_27340 [Kitasatospora sp. NPDC056076]|uniref:hypothetical protein n=1 Tax=Kitasatospora sp. NPDC056076 TaxID=3345703 RepID=UPI0035D95774